MQQSYLPKHYCWDGRSLQAATSLRPTMLAFLHAHPYLRVFAAFSRAGHSELSDHRCGFALDLVPLTQDERGKAALEAAIADAKTRGYPFTEFVWTASNKHAHISFARCSVASETAPSLDRKERPMSLRKKLVHYGEIFAAAFGVTLLVNGEAILGAHGLNAVKSLAVAALIAATKAGWDAVKATVPTASKA